jgi:DNA-directed RNA polymerase specialized sigma24 family protein
VEVPHLVRAAASGDQHAWDALVGQFAPLVWAVARAHGLGVAAAADVAQTTWLRLVESLSSVPVDELGCWLATSTRTEALHALRWADPHLDVRTRRPDVEELAAAVESLPARSRLTVRLLAVPGISMSEVAAGLGLDEAHTDVLVSQSLERLGAILDGLGVRGVAP